MQKSLGVNDMATADTQNALPNTVPHYKATTKEFLFSETQTPEMAQRKQKVDLNDGAF